MRAEAVVENGRAFASSELAFNTGTAVVIGEGGVWGRSDVVAVVSSTEVVAVVGHVALGVVALGVDSGADAVVVVLLA